MIILGDSLRKMIEEVESTNVATRDEVIERLCESILAAYIETVPEHDSDATRVIFDEETNELGVFTPKEVVQKVTNPFHEISLTEARGFFSDVVLGEVLEVEVTPADMSKIFELASMGFS